MQKINVVKKIVALSLMVLVGTGAIVSAQAPGEAPTDMTFEDWRRAQRQLNGQPEEVRDEQQRLDELTALAYGAHQWRRESEGQQPWVSPDEVRQMMQDDETGDLIERAEALNRTFTHLRQLVEQQEVHQVHIDNIINNFETAAELVEEGNEQFEAARRYQQAQRSRCQLL